MKMEERGTQAWGASNGVEIVKHLGPITSTWGEELERFSHWDRGIFHTRLASQGSSTCVDNAHPFRAVSADGIEYTGIHNGCLSNHSELNKTYSRTCTVDSEHLWLHRAAGLPWKDIRGYANLAWFEFAPQDEGTTPELYLARINSSFLEVIRTGDGGMVFASTQSSMRQAAGLCEVKVEGSYFLTAETVYHLTSEGLFRLEEKAEFEGQYHVNAATAARGGSAESSVNFTQRTTGTGGVGSSSSGTGSFTSKGRCHKCHREKSESRFLLCDLCFEDIAGVYCRVFMKDTRVPRQNRPLIVLAQEAAQLLLTDGAERSTGGFTEAELSELEEAAYAYAR